MDTNKKKYVGTCYYCRKKYVVEEKDALTDISGRKFVVCKNEYVRVIFGKIVHTKCNAYVELNAAIEEPAD